MYWAEGGYFHAKCKDAVDEKIQRLLMRNFIKLEFDKRYWKMRDEEKFAIIDNHLEHITKMCAKCFQTSREMSDRTDDFLRMQREKKKQ